MPYCRRWWFAFSLVATRNAKDCKRGEGITSVVVALKANEGRQTTTFHAVAAKMTGKGGKEAAMDRRRSSQSAA